MRVCIFGASITWGAFDPEGGGWATRLRNYYESLERNVQVYNLGVSGDNTNDLLQRFNVECEARRPDVIVFAIGVNDSQYVREKGNHRVSIDDFQKNLEKLVKQAREFTSTIVFIGLTRVDESKTTPIPWNTERFYDNESIEKYDAVIRKLAERENCVYVAIDNVLSIDDLQDGLHPNSTGHRKLFELLKEKIPLSKS